MMDCWSQYPAKRPTFGTIRAHLEGLMVADNKKDYIDMRIFEGDDMGPYQHMESAHNNSNLFGEDGAQVAAEGMNGDGGIGYFDHLHSADRPQTGNQYFDRLKSDNENDTGNGKPYFDQLLPHGRRAQSQTPRPENGSENHQYFEHLAERPKSSGVAGDSYFDRLTAGESGSGNDQQNRNGNTSLTAAIVGRALSSLSQNAPKSPSAIGDRTSFRSRRGDDEISICSQNIEELDTSM